MLPRFPGDSPRDLSRPLESIRILVDNRLAGQRLDVALATTLTWRSRSSLRRLLDAGLVQLDGQQAPASRRVRLGDTIVVEIPPAPTPAPRADQPTAVAIVYEDAWMVAVDKPPGMAVHPSGRHLDGTLLHELHRRYRRPDDPEHDVVPRRLTGHENASGDLESMRIRINGTGRRAGTPTVHPQAVLGPADVAAQVGVGTPDEVLHDGRHDRLELLRIAGHSGRRGSGPAPDLAGRDIPGEAVQCRLESPPEFVQLGGFGRSVLRGFTPGPGDRVFVGATVRCDQHLPEAGGEQRPEMMHPFVTDVRNRLRRLVVPNLGHGPPHGFHGRHGVTASSAESSVASVHW